MKPGLNLLNPDDERGPTAGLAVDVDRPVMPIDDPFHEAEP
jgi:hypothetical protein